MKQLLLMRHAKSSWDDKIKEDYDRFLSKRGKKNASQMGELLKDEKIVPGVIVSSSAIRASQTADLMIETMKYHGDRCFLNSLYMAEVETLRQVIQGLPNGSECALIIGHNPGLDSLLQMLTRKVENLPTAALALLTLPIDDWKAFNLETEAELVHLWRPKDL